MIAAVSGYCVRNPNGPTGWGYVLENGSWRAGGLVRGNTSVGELMSVLMLLKDFPNEDLTIQSTSKYVVGACSLWKNSWQRKNYLKDDGTQRGNLKFLVAIHHLIDSSTHNIQFEKIPEHNFKTEFPLNASAYKFAIAAANKAHEKGVEVMYGNI